MNFAPKTEKEIAEANLIPAGTYPFEAISAEPKQSKAGNQMIVLNLRVFLSDGREKLLFDYLLESPAYKLFHFCAFTGLGTQYSTGALQAHDCVGRTGFVKIGIQKDDKGEYPDRNSVRDYVRQEIKGTAGASVLKPQPTENELANLKPSGGPDEDVPF